MTRTGSQTRNKPSAGLRSVYVFILPISASQEVGAKQDNMHEQCSGALTDVVASALLIIADLSWLVSSFDVIALSLVMWPLSWYQFCVSLPLEVRTVGLVLFLQVLTLFSVLHCLPPAGHVESVFSDSVFSAAVRCNTVNYITQKWKCFCYLCRPCPPVCLALKHCL